LALESQRKTRLEDPGADLLDSFSSQWEQYGRQFLAVVGVLLVAGVVSFFLIRSRRTAEDAAAGTLAEATIYYFQGDLQKAQQVAKQVSDQYGNTASGNDAHRVIGDTAFWNSDFKTAVAEYRRYLGKQSTGPLADAVSRSLAYSLENDHQFAEAARLYNSLVGKFDRESSGEFLAASARCKRLAGDREAARKDLERLISEYGDTSYARIARLEAAELATAP
jgi:predicted negative regulator of RcsB-dependent stress response